jgi:hypothetical protein
VSIAPTAAVTGPDLSQYLTDVAVVPVVDQERFLAEILAEILSKPLSRAGRSHPLPNSGVVAEDRRSLLVVEESC